MFLINWVELSEVLWNMVFSRALSFSGGIGIVTVFAIFTVWAGKSL